MNPSLRYLSYLLRLWQTQDQDRVLWRASLESPGTGERQGFADLEELVQFLRTRMGDEGERGREGEGEQGGGGDSLTC